MKWILLLWLCISCYDSTSYDGNQGLQENEDLSLSLDAFSTRLTNQLQISGTKCQGNEVADFVGQIFECLPGQWLVVVDYVNLCTPERCTEVHVEPTISTITFSTGNGRTQFFVITPVMPLPTRSREHLEDVYLRVDEERGATIVRRQ